MIGFSLLTLNVFSHSHVANHNYILIVAQHFCSCYVTVEQID